MARKKNAPPPAVHSGDGSPPQQVVVVERRGSWWKILLVVCVLLVGLIVGCAALLSGAVDEVIREGEAQDQAVLDAVEIADCGIDPLLGFGQATVTYTSPFDELKSWVSVDIAFTDQDGVSVGTATAAFENVGPGRIARDDASWPVSDGTTSVRCEAVAATVLD